MGYYTEYLSTVFKGPFATAVKERFESRRAIRNLRASDKKLYKDLPRLVEKEHRVTKAISEEDRVIKELKIAAANGYALAFNASTMDRNILEAINNLIDAWNKAHELSARTTNAEFKHKIEEISRIFVTLMQKAVYKAEKEEREEYKDVMIITDESEKKNHEQFMQAVRLRFQSTESQSLLAKFAIRAEIRAERRFLEGIKKIATKCEQLAQKIGAQLRSKKTDEVSSMRLLSQFEAFAKESEYDIGQAFYEAYLIKKRDFLLMMKVIVNTNVLKQLNRKWIAMHFMPEVPVREREANIDAIEDKIGKEFHTIAQALRISISGIQKVKAKLARAA